jgi:hypothetical protein
MQHLWQIWIQLSWSVIKGRKVHYYRSFIQVDATCCCVNCHSNQRLGPCIAQNFTEWKWKQNDVLGLLCSLTALPWCHSRNYNSHHLLRCDSGVMMKHVSCLVTLQPGKWELHQALPGFECCHLSRYCRLHCSRRSFRNQIFILIAVITSTARVF